MKRVALHTLGCKLNYAETSTIGRQFADRGYSVVDATDPADVFILNTCSVTERADRECRQIIRRALRTSPDAYVIVVGCYAQLQPNEIASIEGVDLILGAREKFGIFDRAGEFRKQSTPQVFVSCIDEAVDFAPAFSAEVGGRTRAFLKIQDGCDYICSFCTIPLARGESRSTPVADVIRQAQHLAELGYKEIVLTGVNVGDYGKKADTNLLTLVRELEGIDGIERYRISSIEPNLLTDELIDFVLSSRTFCNHFHIPLQSGSDTILRKMRRRYLSADYQHRIERILQQDPETGIGVDVIVGFPGETDALFEETYRFLADLPISYLHVFTYSERPDTVAAGFPEVVVPAVRSKRNEMLRILSQKKRAAFHRRFLGRSLPVLFESNTEIGSVSGYTSNYIRVEVDENDVLTNSVHDVILHETENDRCKGILQSATLSLIHSS